MNTKEALELVLELAEQNVLAAVGLVHRLNRGLYY
jgi:hypothetical protein